MAGVLLNSCCLIVALHTLLAEAVFSYSKPVTTYRLALLQANGSTPIREMDVPLQKYSMGTAGVSRIFLLNLARRPDRLKRFQIEIATRFGLAVDVFHGIDGLRETNPTIVSVIDKAVSNRKDFRNQAVTRGKTGCALTYAAIWKLICKENIATAMIIEDDLEIKDDAYFSRIPAFLQKAPTDWDLIFLSWCQRYLKFRKLSPMFDVIRRIRCTHHFAVTRHAACQLYRWMEMTIEGIPPFNDTFWGSDELVSWAMDEGGLRGYKLRRMVSFQRFDIRSDVSRNAEVYGFEFNQSHLEALRPRSYDDPKRFLG